MAETASKSRTPFDPSSSRKPPETLVFFIERSLGRRKVAEALRRRGVRVEIHDDYFPADAKDEDWLDAVGKRGWIVLTKDRRIRYRRPELDALLKAGVAAFVLTSGNLTGDEMAAIFVDALPRIRKFAARHAPPFIAKLTRSGLVSLLFTSQRGRRRSS